MTPPQVYSERRGRQNPLRVIVLALVLLTPGCDAFAADAERCWAVDSARARAVAPTVVMAAPLADDRVDTERNRRSVLASLLTYAGLAVMLPSRALAENETMERGGVKLTPFNSLAFNYRGGGSPTIDASSLDEASIPYSEFLERLNSDQVEFVEFLAPNGDAAYATFKSTGSENSNNSSNKPVRIGEGYPLEDPEGWSSPAFVIKAVAKKGVPYRFVVPGLGDSFKL